MVMSSALPRQSPSFKQPFVFAAADTTILEALLRYHFLTNTQLTRVVYDSKSDSRIRERLKRLCDAGFCQASSWRQLHHGQGGSNRFVYHLGPQGLKFLRTRGFDVPRRLRLSDPPYADLFFSHTIAANDVLIATELLGRRHAGVSVTRLLSERQLKRVPARVSLPDGTSRTYTADGWLDILTRDASSRTGRFRNCILLELDQGTESQRAWRRKCAACLSYSRTTYREQFGTDVLTIAVVATPGIARRNALLAWTQAELEALGAGHEAELFLFTALAPDSDPVEFCGGAHWYQPHNPTPLPLLTWETPG
jgi:hypothetical protein